MPGAYAMGVDRPIRVKRFPGALQLANSGGNRGLEVLIKDQLPAYITWSQYERNVRQLQANTAQALVLPVRAPRCFRDCSFVVVAVYAWRHITVARRTASLQL